MPEKKKTSSSAGQLLGVRTRRALEASGALENNVNGPSINCVTGHLPKIAECVFKVRVFPVALKGFCIFLFPLYIIKKRRTIHSAHTLARRTIGIHVFVAIVVCILMGQYALFFADSITKPLCVVHSLYIDIYREK